MDRNKVIGGNLVTTIVVDILILMLTVNTLYLLQTGKRMMMMRQRMMSMRRMRMERQENEGEAGRSAGSRSRSPSMR